MICSLRFYFRDVSEQFDAQTALDILNHLSRMLSLHYTHYRCAVDFGDDRRAGDEYAFPAGEAGKAKLLHALGNLHVSENRDKLTCFFLSGISKGKKDEAFSPRCEFVLTPGRMASHLSIDFPYDRQRPNMHVDLYVQIIEYLSSCGLAVNNSFCHTVSRWRQTHAFDSIHVVTSPIDLGRPRIILKHAARHSLKCRLDCLANIYWGNSISIALLTPGEVRKLTEMLGADCVRETAQSLIFALSAFPRPFPAALCKSFRIRRLLKEHIA